LLPSFSHSTAARYICLYNLLILTRVLRPHVMNRVRAAQLLHDLDRSKWIWVKNVLRTTTASWRRRRRGWLKLRVVSLSSCVRCVLVSENVWSDCMSWLLMMLRSIKGGWPQNTLAGHFTRLTSQGEEYNTSHLYTTYYCMRVTHCTMLLVHLSLCSS
jgi:hypothetical protein